jgi:poly-gamma-glutamate capsule biosynthesis protein CapA/YwtB (metallophosphatase superfamily)
LHFLKLCTSWKQIQNIPINAEISVNMYDRTKIVAEIKALVGKVDLIVLIPHWGIDKLILPAPWQRRDAKAFIQAGAHLIIGATTLTPFKVYEKIK